MLAPPTLEALDLIAAHADRVVEIGAGGGTWARALRGRGMDVIAFDKAPGGEGVTLGDHDDAAAEDGALLMVWPPDGGHARLWILSRSRGVVMIAGDMNRMLIEDALDAYDLAASCHLPVGRKGASMLHIFVRREG